MGDFAFGGAADEARGDSPGTDRPSLNENGRAEAAVRHADAEKIALLRGARRASRAAGGAAGGRRSAGGHFAGAAHFDLHAPVGLQAGDELRAFLPFALFAGDRLRFTAALGLHALLLDAFLRKVLLDRFGALGGELLVVLLGPDAVGVAHGE